MSHLEKGVWGGQAWDRNGAPCASGSGQWRAPSLSPSRSSVRQRREGKREGRGLAGAHAAPPVGDGAALKFYLWFGLLSGGTSSRQDPSWSCPRRLKRLSSILRIIRAGFLTGVESQNLSAFSSGQCAKSTRRALEEHPTVGRRICKPCPQPVMLRASTKKPPRATGSHLPTHPPCNCPA